MSAVVVCCTVVQVMSAVVVCCTVVQVMSAVVVCCFLYERRLRVFENGMLRRIFGPKRDEVNYIMRNLMIITTYQILLM